MRGTGVFSNRSLVRTTGNIRLKLAKNKEKKNAIERFDVKKLSSDKIRKRLNIRGLSQKFVDTRSFSLIHNIYKWCGVSNERLMNTDFIDTKIVTIVLKAMK